MAGVPAMEQGDAAVDGVDVGERVAVDGEDVGVEAGREPTLAAGEIAVEAEGDASDPGDVRCGIPGFDHPGTEMHGDALRSTDPVLRWEVRGRRHAAFTTDFDYRSGT